MSKGNILKEFFWNVLVWSFNRRESNWIAFTPYLYEWVIFFYLKIRKVSFFFLLEKECYFVDIDSEKEIWDAFIISIPFLNLYV